MNKLKPKVLFMVQLPPPTHGPALRNESLIKSKYLNSIINIETIPLKFSNTIHQIGKFSFAKYFKVITYLVILIKRLYTFRPEIVYFTISPIGGSFIRDCLFVLVLKLFKVKRVFHLRGLGIKNAFQKSRFKQILYRWAFKDSYIIFLSNGHKKDLCFSGFREDFVIANGIEDEYCISIQNKKITSYKLLFFSNLVTTKGVFIFIDTVKILIEKGYKVSAIICGENGDLTHEDVYYYICERGLEREISLKNGLFGRDKFTLISECDIFVLPTYVELFPGVILEAMQCGKAIVSTTTGAISEIIDHRINGLLASKPKDASAIADLVEYYMLNPEYISIHGLAARKKYVDNFTIEKFENNMANMFLSVNNSI